MVLFVALKNSEMGNSTRQRIEQRDSTSHLVMSTVLLAVDVVVPPAVLGRGAHQGGELLAGELALGEEDLDDLGEVDLGAAEVEPGHQLVAVEGAGLVGVDEVEGLAVGVLEVALQGAVLLLLEALDQVLSVLALVKLLAVRVEDLKCGDVYVFTFRGEREIVRCVFEGDFLAS